MKIAILTLPLSTNYGGILQAYALQQVLISLGHDVITIDRKQRDSSSFKIMLSKLKRKLLKHHSNLILTKSQRVEIAAYSTDFIKQNISLSESIESTEQLKAFFAKNNFDVVIAGSDQVWRPMYSPNIYNYFFDFLDENNNIKKISYAASFGTDEWEYSEKEAIRCAVLMQQFDAVSVREDSGIRMCEKYLNKHPEHHIDPTMLLDMSDYIKLFSHDRKRSNKKTLYTYVLDRTAEKQKIIDSIAEHKNLTESFSQPVKAVSNNEGTKFKLDDFIYPPVGEWIKGFYDADFVITDSFHGTVFSILFNKPFVAIGNAERGMDRFVSLLKMFNLEDRLITKTDNFDVNSLFKSNINWEAVNLVLEEEKRKSIDFLRSNLK